MLVKKKASFKKNLILVAVMLFMLGVSGFFIYKNYFPSTGSADGASVFFPFQDKVSLEKVKKDFDEERFSTPEFEKMRIYGDIPVEVKSLGKDNPFVSE